MNNAIEISNLSKRYRLGTQIKSETFVDAIFSTLKSPFTNYKNLSKLSKFNDENENDVFWALKHIDLTIKKGEVVGIIGPNGAGKSTFLKVLSKITSPTIGEIKIQGRVASLLEVGTGFHPDLTGRENIYLNGTMLGLSKKEVDERLNDIIEFSEITKFIDTPVKRYSSGMYVRLAFSVAAHLEPDILIIDEVLAVGDQGFKEKCIGRMQTLSEESARTILFVSHEMTAIQKLCNRAIFIKNGQLINDGTPNEIIKNYISNLEDTEVNFNRNRRGDGFAKVKDVQLFDLNYKKKNVFMFSEPFIVEIEIECEKELNNLFFKFAIKNQLGVIIFYSASTQMQSKIKMEQGVSKFRIKLNPNYFMPGDYSIEIKVVHNVGLSDYVEDSVKFKIVEAPYGNKELPDFPDYGHIYYNLQWEKV